MEGLEPESAEIARIELQEEAEISCCRQREQHMQRFENVHRYCEWGTAYGLVWPTFGWEVGKTGASCARLSSLALSKGREDPPET